MTAMPPADPDLFDEAGYLRLYPGIAEAIILGEVRDAWAHYDRHGRAEDRRPNDVDPTFYLAVYPAIELDLGRPPEPADAAPHFLALGRARGYLPNATAPRPANGAALFSPFGGFWTDQANALDLIQARLDLDRCSPKEAEMLRAFALDGIATLDRPFDAEQFAAARLALDHAFTGRFQGQLIATEAGIEPWRPELTEQHAAALDPHMLSGAVRAMLLDKAVMEFLALIFDAPPRLTASRGYLRESAAAERDAARMGFTLPLMGLGITFVLEPEPSGKPTVWPGSHHLPDLVHGGRHINFDEARRLNAPELAAAARAQEIGRLVGGPEEREVQAKFGGRILRHANLIHRADPPPPLSQNRSITAWYCPSYVSPCYVETVAARWHRQNGVAFASAHYPAHDPAD